MGPENHGIHSEKASHKTYENLHIQVELQAGLLSLKSHSVEPFIGIDLYPEDVYSDEAALCKTDRIFPYDEEFTHSEWWHENETLRPTLHDFLWVSAYLDNKEIARVQLQEEFSEDYGKEIYVMTFEVAQSMRRVGYGRFIVSLLEAHFKGVPMTACAKDDPAGRFWAATGWTFKPNFHGENETDSFAGVYWSGELRKLSL